jgi:hypothetical protein
MAFRVAVFFSSYRASIRLTHRCALARFSRRRALYKMTEVVRLADETNRLLGKQNQALREQGKAVLVTDQLNEILGTKLRATEAMVGILHKRLQELEEENSVLRLPFRNLVEWFEGMRTRGLFT